MRYDLHDAETSAIKVIGENRFIIRPFPAYTSIRIVGDLASVLAPLIESVAPAFCGDDEDVGDVKFEQVVFKMCEAFAELPGDKLERLMRSLLTEYGNISVVNSSCGESTVFSEDIANTMFVGDISGMLALAFDVIQLNYDGFFYNLRKHRNEDTALRIITPAKKE